MAKTTAFDSVLNDIEKLELQRFADNQTMYEAVRKVILFNVYFNGTLRPGEPANPLRNYCLAKVAQNTMSNNDVLANELRAVWEATNILEAGYETIMGYRSEAPEKERKNENPAR